MLSLERVGKTYPNGVHALDAITLGVEPGEIVVVIGGSGCGKSTLLRAISGLDTPTQGSVLLDDMPITTPHEAVGIIFQEPRLLPWLTVAGNVGFGIEDRPKHERAERVAHALDRVGLSEKANMWPRELSGGQAQRVAIARALVPRPAGAAARRAVLRARRLHPRRPAGSPAQPVGRVQADAGHGHPRRRGGDRARRPHRGDAAASRSDRRRDRDRFAAPARPPVGGVRFRQAARARRARPFARPRGGRRASRAKAAQGAAMWW